MQFKIGKTSMSVMDVLRHIDVGKELIREVEMEITRFRYELDQFCGIEIDLDLVDELEAMQEDLKNNMHLIDNYPFGKNDQFLRPYKERVRKLKELIKLGIFVEDGEQGKETTK